MTISPPISIRPYVIDDVEPLFMAVIESRGNLQPWMPWCHAEYAIQDTRTWVETQVKAFPAGSEYAFAIVDAAGVLLGGCGLNHIDRLNRCANLGYWVRSTSARRGVAVQASRLLAQWAFSNTELIRLEVLAPTENLASQRVAERIGAVREGILRSRATLQGRAHDAVVYSLLRDDPKPA